MFILSHLTTLHVYGHVYIIVTLAPDFRSVNMISVKQQLLHVVRCFPVHRVTFLFNEIIRKISFGKLTFPIQPVQSLVPTSNNGSQYTVRPDASFPLTILRVHLVILYNSFTTFPYQFLSPVNTVVCIVVFFPFFFST